MPKLSTIKEIRGCKSFLVFFFFKGQIVNILGLWSGAIET